jgi:hypothetical protein
MTRGRLCVRCGEEKARHPLCRIIIKIVTRRGSNPHVWFRTVELECRAFVPAAPKEARK